MAERMLIVKLVRTGPTTADLYARGHKYADLKLFDLAELQALGLDPASLPIGQETPARFWAHYEVSDKKKASGRPYLDVIALERADAPATATSADNSALLAELRAIRALLQAIAEAQGLQVPELPPVAGDEPHDEGNGNGGPHGQDLDELTAAFPRYGDGQALGDNEAERTAYQAHVDETGQAPASLAALRAWVKSRRVVQHVQ